MTPYVEYLEENTKGTDYVVGDLHGERGLLDRLLACVRFDASCDRLISVGDFVDRGPTSEACAELLFERWVHAVLGNHEDMLAQACHEILDTGYGGEATLTHWDNGGAWFAQHLVPETADAWRPDEWGMRLLARIDTLPLALVVGRSMPSRFNVVHAELPQDATDALLDGGAFSPDAFERKQMIWGRTLMTATAPLPQFRQGLSSTYCGHSPDSDIRLRHSHICIDTGAFYPHFGPEFQHCDFGLTLVRPADRRAWKIHPEDGTVTESGY